MQTFMEFVEEHELLDEGLFKKEIIYIGKTVSQLYNQLLFIDDMDIRFNGDLLKYMFIETKDEILGKFIICLLGSDKIDYDTNTFFNTSTDFVYESTTSSVKDFVKQLENVKLGKLKFNKNILKNEDIPIKTIKNGNVITLDVIRLNKKAPYVKNNVTFKDGFNAKVVPNKVKSSSGSENTLTFQ